MCGQPLLGDGVLNFLGEFDHSHCRLAISGMTLDVGLGNAKVSIGDMTFGRPLDAFLESAGDA